MTDDRKMPETLYVMKAKYNGRIGYAGWSYMPEEYDAVYRRSPSDAARGDEIERYTRERNREDTYKRAALSSDREAELLAVIADLAKALSYYRSQGTGSIGKIDGVIFGYDHGKTSDAALIKHAAIISAAQEREK